jgi:hypothetical protein
MSFYYIKDIFFSKNKLNFFDEKSSVDFILDTTLHAVARKTVSPIPLKIIFWQEA